MLITFFLIAKTKDHKLVSIMNFYKHKQKMVYNNADAQKILMMPVLLGVAV